MEEIFKQSFEFAQIKLFKNYSTISKKKIFEDINYNPVTNIPSSDNTFKKLNALTFKFDASLKSSRSIGYLLLHTKDSKKKTFYTDDPDCERSVMGHSEKIKCRKIKLENAYPSSLKDELSNDYFETTKESQIKRHFGNPFASIIIYKYERWIKKDGDKIIIKFYKSEKSRDLNAKYFSRGINSSTITFDLKTGNFNCLIYNKTRGKQTKVFYSNSFTALCQSLHSIYQPVNKFSSSKYRTEFFNEFNERLFNYAVQTAFGFNKTIYAYTNGILEDYGVKKMVNDFISEWTQKFIVLRKIKMPNDGIKLISDFYPTEKFLKKNDRKLVASILDRFEIKSKITIKLLHTFPSLDMLELIRICFLFGNNFSKYIGNINPECFFTKTESGYPKATILDWKKSREGIIMDITDDEKENMVKIINDYQSRYASLSSTQHSICDMFYDHFFMLSRIREYYPDMRLHSTAYNTFISEHTRVSIIENAIQKGYSIHLIFESHIINEIEKEIICYELESSKVDDIKSQALVNFQTSVFHPVLLKTSEEYTEEGKYMHHCVSGYITHENSIIVSLRLGGERVTCEFDIKSRKCRQAYTFFDKQPPERFKKPLEILYERIKSIPLPIGPIDRQTVALIINGKEVKKARSNELHAFPF